LTGKRIGLAGSFLAKKRKYLDASNKKEAEREEQAVKLSRKCQAESTSATAEDARKNKKATDLKKEEWNAQKRTGLRSSGKNPTTHGKRKGKRGLRPVNGREPKIDTTSPFMTRVAKGGAWPGKRKKCMKTISKRRPAVRGKPFSDYRKEMVLVRTTFEKRLKEGRRQSKRKWQLVGVNYLLGVGREG